MGDEVKGPSEADKKRAEHEATKIIFAAMAGTCVVAINEMSGWERLS